jgi:capsular polysaccharide biosynthesis protein
LCRWDAESRQASLRSEEQAITRTDPRIDLSDAALAPRRSLFEAVRANPLRVALPVVVLLGLAAAVGLTRTPVYTAETRLNVGRLDGDILSVPGFAAGVQSLAVGYSRVVGAKPVIARTARELNVPTAEIAGRISAAPIPESPLFRIFATGTSEKGAETTANAAARAFIAYVDAGSRRDRDDQRIVRQYLGASVQLASAQQRLAKIRVDSGRRRSRGGKDVTLRERRAIAQAIGLTQTQALRTETLKGLYRASTQGISGVNFVRVIDTASGATNDRSSKLQKLLFTALIAGLVLGAAFAYFAPSPSTYVPRHARRPDDS